MNERELAELKRDEIRSVTRRRIVKVSVGYNIIIGLFYMFASFFLEPSQADILKDFNSIAITILGGNFSLIGAYFALNKFGGEKWKYP